MSQGLADCSATLRRCHLLSNAIGGCLGPVLEYKELSDFFSSLRWKLDRVASAGGHSTTPQDDKKFAS